MNRKHTRKHKDHKKQWHPDDVEIEKQKWIRFVEHDWNAVEKFDIDKQLASTEPFWRSLEVNCVAECCGIQAHSFFFTDIWNAVRQCKVESLAEKLVEVRDVVSAASEEVVVSEVLNQLLDKQMFLDLLDHTVGCVKQMKATTS